MLPESLCGVLFVDRELLLHAPIGSQSRRQVLAIVRKALPDRFSESKHCWHRLRV